MVIPSVNIGGFFGARDDIIMSHSSNLSSTYVKGSGIINITDAFSSLLEPPDEEEVFHGQCLDSMLDLGQSYKSVHGYIALVICVFGTVANILNLIVLKEMSSPINRMLTALAFADMLVMLEYIPFAIQMYIVPTENFSYPWALFVLFHSHFTQVFHTISIQLTLTMAVWRYIAIKCSNRSSSYCTFKRCNLCILASYTCPFLLCIPNYLTFAIYYRQSFFMDGFYAATINNKPRPDKSEYLAFCKFLNDPDCVKAIRGIGRYVVDLSEMAKANGGRLHAINFWTFSVFIKLIPCLVLTFFMCWLLNTLYKAKRRHTMLQKSAEMRMRSVSTPNAALRGHGQSQAPLVIIGKEESTMGPIKLENCNGNGNGHHEPIVEDQPSNMPSCVGNEGRSHSKVGFRSFPTLLRKSSPKTKSCKRSDKTSKMLVAVLFLFLLTEFPQGIMAFLSGFYGQEFFRYCYSTWAEIWDILALFNSAVNFVLYCFMSRQFRLQFQQLFKLNSRRWIPSCNTTVSTTV